MNTLRKRICSLVIAACLICMSVVPAMADSTVTTAGTDTVSASEVRTEAKATARFLMDNTDFTDISNTSTFYNASRNLILSVRSGYDCSVQADAYLKNVDALLNADGTLNLENASSFANDIYSNYAYLLLTLAVLDKDAADYNGINVVAAFDNIIANATSDELTNNLNPYLLGAYYAAIASYKDSLTNADNAVAVTKTALLALCTDNSGIDYWGHSADNNGTVLPFFASLYETDAEVKKQIDGATAYTTSLANPEDGTITSWGSLNSDSTALALAMQAQYGDAAFAATTYKGFVANFKSDKIEGAYTPIEDYYNPEKISTYASQDAMIGLVTYLYALEGKANPFDVSAEVKAIADAKNNASDDNTNTPSDNTKNDADNSGSTEDSTTADNSSATDASTDNSANASTEASSVSADSSTASETSVQTADSYNVYLYAVLALAAVSGICTAGYAAKKNRA